MFRLRIEGGTRNGEGISLTPGKTLVCGRGREADVRFPEDATMSRVQAELTWDGAAWTLVNKSQHGSLVNGQRVDGSRVLAPGDQLVLGGTHVTYELDPSPAAAPAPTMPEAAPGGATPLPMPRDLAPDAPGAPAAAPAPGAKPATPKKPGGSKAVLIIAVIGALFSCCCLSGIGVWYFKYKKPSSSSSAPPPPPPSK
ncbi:MAG TPA: FHA domain-containing protein [Planctomycetota bacterium]|nr:FHA domain-containing protein [Planctomycetota bacterium]